MPENERQAGERQQAAGQQQAGSQPPHGGQTGPQGSKEAIEKISDPIARVRERPRNIQLYELGERQMCFGAVAF